MGFNSVFKGLNRCWSDQGALADWNEI